jgi:sugar transferase (PEP-CTERM/EpsH1 system associated)
MARILMLAHRMPYPPNKGDKIRAFHVLRHLAQRHEVRLACLVDDPADLAHEVVLKDLVDHLAVARIDGRLRRLLSARALLSDRSVTVTHFYKPELQAVVDGWLDELPFDGVMCSSAATAEYLFRSRHWQAALKGAAKVMDLIDVDSTKWAQYAVDASPLMSWVYRHEASTLATYERRIVSDFDRVFLVSPSEAALLDGSGFSGKVDAFSNGVDLDYFAPGFVSQAASLLSDAGPLIVFTGVMDYRPNVEGVEWFARQVFPSVRSRVPDARFAIVGSRPTAPVQALAELPGVTVTGFVDDVRDWLSRASVCVAPLLIARGIQNKVLEAMAMGKAVIATPEAFEGVSAVEGRDLIVAKAPIDFADKVVELLMNPQRAGRIGGCARQRVEQAYQWSTNLAVLDEVFA